MKRWKILCLGLGCLPLMGGCSLVEAVQSKMHPERSAQRVQTPRQKKDPRLLAYDKVKPLPKKKTKSKPKSTARKTRTEKKPQKAKKKPVVSKRPKKKAEPETKAARRTPKSKKKYTVRKGDTLQKIARKYYGSHNAWPRIYDANRTRIKSPDLIYVGQVIHIP